MDKVNAIDRIRVLKTAARDTILGYRTVVSGLCRGIQESSCTDPLVHDNMRIIKADSKDFAFQLDPSKYQIVIVLSGNWTVKHGSTVRHLGITDVIKVPMDPTTPTTLIAEGEGAKFAYVQFRK